MSDLADAAKELGGEIFGKVKGKIGDLWDGLSDDDKEMVKYASKRFAVLSFKKLKGDDVERDLIIVEATLANLSYVGTQRVYRAFWETANEIVGVGAKFLQGIIGAKLA